jgi:hypothetical protein
MKRTIAFVTVILFSLSTTALAAETIKNWSAPSTWTPPSAQATGRSALIAAYPPLPFIPVTPCRVADTRVGFGFSGQYGPPFMAGGVPRSFMIWGQCGIPVGATAVSFNFTVTNTAGAGFLLVFPEGGAPPNVSTLNYVASQTIANAAVVPLGSGGLTAIPGVSGFNLLIDVNGYYTSSVGTSPFVVESTGGYGIIGTSTTNVGVWGLGPTAGVFGQDSSGAGKGVYGLSPSGLGVYGLSTSGIGVEGTSTTGVGVEGLSTNNVAVQAFSTTYDAIWAVGGRHGINGYGAANGVIGTSTGTGSGMRYGVTGSSASTTKGSAGGYFVDSTGGPVGLSTYLSSSKSFTTGVIGASSGSGGAGPGGIGVLGVVNDAYAAVGGVSLNPASPYGWESAGWLGWSTTLAGYFEGNVDIVSSPGGAGNLIVVGNLSKGTGTFKIDDPIDPENKYLYHSFVESPDMMNIYNGIVELDALGEAIVQLPAYFEALNKDFRYQLTSIGQPQPNLFVADEIQNLQFRISGGKPHAKASWQVTGVRQDPLANANRVIPEVEKEPQAKGYYLHWAAYKQPAEKSLTDHLTAIKKTEALKNDR